MRYDLVALKLFSAIAKTSSLSAVAVFGCRRKRPKPRRTPEPPTLAMTFGQHASLAAGYRRTQGPISKLGKTRGVFFRRPT